MLVVVVLALLAPVVVRSRSRYHIPLVRILYVLAILNASLIATTVLDKKIETEKTVGF